MSTAAVVWVNELRELTSRLLSTLLALEHAELHADDDYATVLRGSRDAKVVMLTALVDNAPAGTPATPLDAARDALAEASTQS